MAIDKGKKNLSDFTKKEKLDFLIYAILNIKRRVDRIDAIIGVDKKEILSKVVNETSYANDVSEIFREMESIDMEIEESLREDSE